jgi:hypothetical protein
MYEGRKFSVVIETNPCQKMYNVMEKIKSLKLKFS